jgi:hypothetical protein
MNTTDDDRDEKRDAEFQAVEGFCDKIRDGGDDATDELLIQLDAIDGHLDKGDTEMAREYIARLIEDCFRQSDTYRHALALYRNTFNLAEGRNLNKLLQGLIDRFIHRRDKEKPAEDKLLEPVIDAQDWIQKHSLTEAMREKYAPAINRIREIQREAESESEVRHE